MSDGVLELKREWAIAYSGTDDPFAALGRAVHAEMERVRQSDKFAGEGVRCTSSGSLIGITGTVFAFAISRQVES